MSYCKINNNNKKLTFSIKLKLQQKKRKRKYIHTLIKFVKLSFADPNKLLVINDFKIFSGKDNKNALLSY
jgi:hypothetical protein